MARAPKAGAVSPTATAAPSNPPPDDTGTGALPAAVAAIAAVPGSVTPPPEAPARHVYPVRSPLKHGGARYRPDDPETGTITLTEAEAEALQAIGVLGEATGPAPAGE